MVPGLCANAARHARDFRRAGKRQRRKRHHLRHIRTGAALRDAAQDGSEAVQALQVINKEANNPTACGPAVLAFRTGETIKSERMDGQLVRVVKVTVLAYNNGAGWSPVPETVQYAIIVSTDIEA